MSVCVLHVEYISKQHVDVLAESARELELAKFDESRLPEGVSKPTLIYNTYADRKDEESQKG